MSGTRWTLFAALAVLCRRLARRALRRSETWRKRADWCEGRTGSAPGSIKPRGAQP